MKKYYIIFKKIRKLSNLLGHSFYEILDSSIKLKKINARDEIEFNLTFSPDMLRYNESKKFVDGMDEAEKIKCENLMMLDMI